MKRYFRKGDDKEVELPIPLSLPETYLDREFSALAARERLAYERELERRAALDRERERGLQAERERWASYGEQPYNTNATLTVRERVIAAPCRCGNTVTVRVPLPPTYTMPYSNGSNYTAAAAETPYQPPQPTNASAQQGPYQPYTYPNDANEPWRRQRW